MAHDNNALNTALGDGKPPFEEPEVTLPDSDSMVAFSSNEDNKELADEVEEHKAAIPTVQKPNLGLKELGLRR